MTSNLLAVERVLLTNYLAFLCGVVPDHIIHGLAVERVLLTKYLAFLCGVVITSFSCGHTKGVKG